LAIAEYIRDAQKPLTHDPISDLNRARSQFVQRLGELWEGEDPTPLVENFIPAILPVLKAGISLAGRSKVVRLITYSGGQQQKTGMASLGTGVRTGCNLRG
jgi:hypothetical protein